ncbi:MAG: putative toxin-antitoxin system toxin component, PIN family [Anaerolinea sp.]|nr:putative toxin-antitoxin system toxin component, PIN family [Anaerolinea sp.]
MKVFLDASVLFSAAYSAGGYARDLLVLAVQNRVQAVVSSDVLTEVERNITRKAPDKLESYRLLLKLINAELVADPSLEAVREVESYVVQKDAPIVAAAQQAQVDYLVTYDRKHLIDPVEVAQKSGLRIVTPETVVEEIIRSENE